jgi:DNA-binding IclR family transcriptional regulator
MRVLAYVTAPGGVRAIVEHLGLSTSRARSLSKDLELAGEV